MKGRLQVLLSPRHEHRVLGLMLVLLHAALWWHFAGPVSRSLMLAHLGLFLIWQPVWSRDVQLTWSGLFVFLLATAGFVLWLNWWLATVWLLLLTGLAGGHIGVRRSDRLVYLLTLLFLVSELLIRCIPEAFEVGSLDRQVQAIFGRGLLLLPLLVFLVPVAEGRGRRRVTMDFLYGVFISLLVTVLALGTLLDMYTTAQPYAVALLQTVLALGVFLIAISWLWAPLAGFSGLGEVWERYLLNIGTPFERWLARLAALARRRQSPGRFLDSAMAQLAALPWVAGVSWETAASAGQRGETSLHLFRVCTGELRTTVYVRRPVGAALQLHGKLLVLLIGHFYRARLREQELTERAHLQAIYETGARVTHDIKNLLQSLHGITMALESSRPERRQQAQELMARQLPHITRRLQLALEKLQAPEERHGAEMLLSRWWEGLKARHAEDGIRFLSDLQADPLVPAELFDSVAENLLENARIKRQSEPDIAISTHLEATAEGTRLTVTDTGSGIAPEVAASLFKSPLRSSRSGLGIGLYQAARQARKLGYELQLREGRDGRVSFELSTAQSGASLVVTQ